MQIYASSIYIYIYISLKPNFALQRIAFLSNLWKHQTLLLSECSHTSITEQCCLRLESNLASYGNHQTKLSCSKQQLQYTGIAFEKQKMHHEDTYEAPDINYIYPAFVLY